MPDSVHHITVQTRHRERLVRFATKVLGMHQAASIAIPRNNVASLMGWPEGPGEVSSAILGGGRAGLLEVVEIPADIVDTGEFTAGTSGILQLCLQVDDLQAVVSDARAFPADVVQGPAALSVGGAVVQVGLVWIAGVRFQLTQMSSH